MMHRLRNHKYLSFLIVFTIIVFCGSTYVVNKIGYFISSGERSTLANDGLMRYIFLWFFVLPLDALYVSRRIYSAKRKWISIVSGIITFFSFIIVIDPGLMSIPGRPTGLQKYEFIQNIMSIIPGFFFILGAVYIVGCDILLRYIGNKIYRSK